MQPFVSIIVPVFNVEPYLARCLNSLLRQTMENIEIICIDDKSADNSLDLLYQFKNVDSRIHVLENTQREGLSVTRNRGIAIASGEYIAFVDSDDWIEANGIQIAYEAGKQNAADIVFFDYQVEYEESTMKDGASFLKNKRCGTYDGTFSGDELFGLFSLYEDHSDVAWGAIYRRSYLIDNKIGFYPNIFAEDKLFYFTAILSANKAMYIPSMHYHYCRNKSSITFNVDPYLEMVSFFTIYMESIRFLKKKNKFFKSMKHIYRFLYSIRHRVKKIILNASHNLIRTVHFSNYEYNIAFQMLCHESENGFTSVLLQKNMDKIISTKHLLVYGAGEKGQNVVEWLIHHGINKFNIVISDDNVKCYLAGNRTKWISEYLPIRDQCLVLVAVGSRYRKEIEDSLEKLGFQYIYAN